MLDQSRAVAQELVQNGILVRVDGAHVGCAHSKVLIIDGRFVITGSFNLTWAAESKNAENLLIVADVGLAEKYRTNWQGHWEHSIEFTNIAQKKGTRPNKTL